MENNSSTLLQLQARFGEDTFTQQTTKDEMLTLWMPMDKTFWGDYFGSFEDKYGVRWMINFANQPKPA